MLDLNRDDLPCQRPVATRVFPASLAHYFVKGLGDRSQRLGILHRRYAGLEGK